jgi:hypothetical protein
MENVQDIERLITEIEATADPATRTGVRQLVEAILEFHGAGIARMAELAGEGVVRSFARDDLAGALLLLYGLHPESFETRVQRAIDRLQGAELVGIADSVVRVKGTASREAIEQALYAAAPEVAAIEIEGEPRASSTFVPLEALFSR